MSDFWPHQFTKLGSPIQVGVEKIYNNTEVPIMAQPMVCVHCKVEYVQNKTPQPGGQCPARNTRREMKRLKNGG